ncbi:MAG: AMP-binding protein [Planctomycetaceae bacterium]|nr:AMP-binding protein [Planctomycetaceae bacterium]
MPLTRSARAARGIARPPGPARRRGPRQGGRGPGPEAPAAAGSAFPPDGWFRTGDVATIDPHGYVQITDRSKDLVLWLARWLRR